MISMEHLVIVHSNLKLKPIREYPGGKIFKIAQWQFSRIRKHPLLTEESIFYSQGQMNDTEGSIQVKQVRNFRKSDSHL